MFEYSFFTETLRFLRVKSFEFFSKTENKLESSEHDDNRPGVRSWIDGIFAWTVRTKFYFQFNNKDKIIFMTKNSPNGSTVKVR